MSKNTTNILILCLCTVCISGCKLWSHQAKSLPPLDKPSYLDLKTANISGFNITLVNHLSVDRFAILRSTIDSVQFALDQFNPVILNPEDSVSFSILTETDSLVYKEIVGSLSGSSYIGNPNTAKPDTSFLYALPVRKGASYRILQGQDGSFTHNTDANRFAIDIATAVGDTVFAARGGKVGYAYDESSYGGNNAAYLDYANTIMILHEDGTIAQYSHLKQNGVLVEMGDTVKMGEPIGLSGNTGFISGEHLHLNVFEPLNNGTKSVFISFKGYEGQWFEKGDSVSH